MSGTARALRASFRRRTKDWSGVPARGDLEALAPGPREGRRPGDGRGRGFRAVEGPERVGRRAAAHLGRLPQPPGVVPARSAAPAARTSSWTRWYANQKCLRHQIGRRLPAAFSAEMVEDFLQLPPGRRALPVLASHAKALTRSRTRQESRAEDGRAQGSAREARRPRPRRAALAERPLRLDLDSRIRSHGIPRASATARTSGEGSGAHPVE